MSNAQYKKKLTNAHDAIKLVQNGETIVVPTGVGEPPTLLTALAERRREFQDVKLAQILPVRQYDYYDKETIANVRYAGYFINAPARKLVQEGYGDFIPNHFSELPLLIRRKLIPVDVVVTLASPMDEHGYFSLSLGVDYTLEALKQARLVILEVNPNVPFAYGNCHVHISDIDAIIESQEPLLEVGLPEIGEVESTIGGYVAEMIPDRATLQIGYGAIPDAVVMQLTNKKDLGIHTEMIGDGILTLLENGVVSNRYKNYLPDKMLATFALGSKKLYNFMHRNPALEMHPVNFTNDPYLAGKNDNLISINATVEVDFMGQCNSETVGGRPYSGTGGQLDFVRAANRSEGGKSFIVLPSTAKGGSISKIVPTLTPGAHVTTGKNEVAFVVTEYGVADLRGKSAQQRTKALIGIAHPKFRDELTEQADRMGFISKLGSITS